MENQGNKQGNKKEETFTVTGNWNNQATKLKEKYSQLTDTDLKFEKGKETELLGRVETRLNKKREEVINILNKTQEECETAKTDSKIS